GTPYDIIGVLPADFHFPVEADAADLFVPFSTIPDSGIPRIRSVRILSVVARAKAGVGAEALRTEMDTIARRLAAQYPENRSWDAAAVVPLHEAVTGPVRSSLWVVFAAVGLVLLLAASTSRVCSWPGWPREDGQLANGRR